MQPHPEGGYFVETYRSNQTVETHNGWRSASTGIFFLLKMGQVSHFHRIKSDEMWHFYMGEPLLILEINENGELEKTILGPDVLNGQEIQHVVKANRWFASTPLEGSTFSFVGCTVAPGFDFVDFEMMKMCELNSFPKIEDEIKNYILKDS